jgi:hypothetical protein
MGRPPVRVKSLLATGVLDMADLVALAPAARGFRENSLLYPRSLVWPMGFSWSSYVAQCTMSQVCRIAGLSLDRQLADDLRSPSAAECFGLATDDICMFSRGGPDACARTAKCIDHAFVEVGVERHVGKDVTGVLNATVIGIDVVDGLGLW